MGEQKIGIKETKEEKAIFIGHLLDDVKALEHMLKNDMFEKGITRIGAEQEFCLVTPQWRPANNSVEILDHINDPHFTTELAKYNLEINLDPIELKGKCFTEMQESLTSLLAKGAKSAKKYDSKIVLTGILPTITKRHLQMDYITPMPRYYTINERMMKIRNNDFRLHLMGVDELNVTHETILFEACNTSFQLHLQVDPEDFISSFNWAQAIAGPVLGICSNSPLLLGRELWHETRIALFRQSCDMRHISTALKDEPPRVAFGAHWASGDATSLYKDNISQHKVIITKEIAHNSMDLLQLGKIPKLEALNLHSGTIYPWNRACYGVGNGIPHLRIENRYIPSGPTILDEMANFAYWIGIMCGRPERFDNIAEVMHFKDAKSNFVNAGRTGYNSVMVWDNKEYTVSQLTEKVMLPLAYKGLRKIGVAEEDIKRLLGVIESRLTGKTGAQWMISNYRNLMNSRTGDDSLRLITRATYENQQTEKPVSEWPDIDSFTNLKSSATRVGQIMSTRVFTVKKSDLAEMATSIMQWKNIHHVPVENKKGKFCGLLTWTHAQKYTEDDVPNNQLVKDIMTEDVLSVNPRTTIKEAIGLMKENGYGCLPILQNKELVGIITTKDIIAFDHD